MFRIHRIDGSREIRGEQVGERGVADLRGVGGSADHRDHARVQQVVYAASLGGLFPGPGHFQRLLGGIDVELDMQHALLESPAEDRKSTRLNSSHVSISYAVFSLQK